MFKDRYEAGIKLAEQLEWFKDDDPLILALPRGGVITAYETINRYNYDWDLIIPKKIGAPHNEENAIGAVTSDGTYYLYEPYIEHLGVTKAYIEEKGKEAIVEINRRLMKYKGNKHFPQVKGRHVILIDDGVGVATGFTLLAAIESVRKHGATHIVVAVPVAPADTILQLNELVDEVIALKMPYDFEAVSQFYEVFDDIQDDEVLSVLLKLKGNNSDYQYLYVL
jgi:putative phosphoribosyl transferase